MLDSATTNADTDSEVAKQLQPQPHLTAPKRHRKQKKQLWHEFESEIVSARAQCKINDSIQNEETRIESSIDGGLCSRCGVIARVSDEGFQICPNSACGVVGADSVDQSPEWRYYGADGVNQGPDPTRCGMPTNPMLKESSFGCTVLKMPSMSYEMHKIKKITNWYAMPHSEKTQHDAFQYITCMARIANIPKMIIDDAIWYHKKISDHPTSFRGDNRDGILGSSIYISCKVNNFPRTPGEISDIFNLDQASVTRGCKNAINIINEVEKNFASADKTVFSKTVPEFFIQRFCSRLNISPDLTKLCQFISIKIEKTNFMPENIPYSIAAGIIYFVVFHCKLNISKQDIKKIANISEVTINKCFKKIDQHKTVLIPSVFMKKYNIT